MARLLRLLLSRLHTFAFRLRFRWRSRGWTPAGTRPRPADSAMIVSGFFREALGIGRAGHLVADALEAAGVSVIREDMRAFERGLLTQPAKSFSTAANAGIWLIEANPPEARLALYHYRHAEWQNLYRIGLWHWESDVAPRDWILMAKWFDEIWTSSDFTRDALAKAMRAANRHQDIEKLRVCPLPVEPPSMHTGRDDDIQVITLFDPRSHFERKNPQAVIAAWLDAFPQPAPHVRLVIKSLDQAAAHPSFHALQAMAPDRPDIVFLCKTLSDDETSALIAQSDILMSLHRGEGFGLTMAEAMGAGVAVIATGWSGNMQFMTERNSIPIPYRLVTASPRYNGPEAKWADPDMDSAAAALRTLVADPGLRAKLGAQARQDIAALRQAFITAAAPGAEAGAIYERA